MTSRTNSSVEGQHLGGTADVTSSPLEQRRQLAVQRYLAGDLIETICQEMGCSKSWLYKWKQRYQATDPTWAQEHSRRPQTTPTRTPESIAAAILQLRQTLSADGTTPVSARVIQEHLSLHPGTALPSRRTIYRILKRQAKPGAAPAIASSWVGALACRVGQLQAPRPQEANGAPRHKSRSHFAGNNVFSTDIFQGLLAVIKATLPVTGANPQRGGVHATTDARFRVTTGVSHYSRLPLHGRHKA